MSPTKVHGDVKEIQIEMTNKDKVRVSMWRACADIAVDVGDLIELWDATCKFNTYLRERCVHVNVPADVKVFITQRLIRSGTICQKYRNHENLNIWTHDYYPDCLYSEPKIRFLGSIFRANSGGVQSFTM